MKEKIIVALRYSRLYVPDNRTENHISVAAAALVERLAEHGYTVSEDAIHALSAQSEEYLASVVNAIENVYGTNLNWTPLVRDWQRDKGIEQTDYLVTWFVNALNLRDVCAGTTMPCGHFIPDGVFDLEHFNGCPFCGTPFDYHTGALHIPGKRTHLDLADDEWLKGLYNYLLESKVPLDATQAECLEQLYDCYGLPDKSSIAIRETAALIAAHLFDAGDYDKGLSLLDNPFDLLRTMWMRITGEQRFISPKALGLSPGRFRYPRRACRAAALWLNSLDMSPADMCRNLNTQRNMWTHAQRALRLPEYARRLRLPHLAEFLDLFYRGDYDTWGGRYQAARQEGDLTEVLAVLSERPGEFARKLFANMLVFNASTVLEAFKAASAKLPLRLVCSLDNNAIPYFMPVSDVRTIVLPGRRSYQAPLNPHLALYPAERLAHMAAQVKTTVLDIYTDRFNAMRTPDTTGRRVYISPDLYKIPVPVGDRSATIQDASAAVQGQRFDIRSDRVRVFLQWGEGLPAQHFDMDLSCRVLYADGSSNECAYYSLDISGLHHSGDITRIPDKVGTAEYIDINLKQLCADDARYVIFTSNAYSCASLSSNMKLGWMDCRYTMKVSDEKGVAYNPAEVQHIVRVPDADMPRGMIFGVLDVEARQIIWLEMPVSTQTLAQMNTKGVMALLDRLKAKITVGELLTVRASALGMTAVDTPADADIAYTDLLTAVPDLFGLS